MDQSATRALLDAERRATLARIRHMTRDFDGIVSAAAGANGDDEHDPEGATVAFERAQFAALLDRARAYLEDLDRAISRLDADLYSVCERCGARIGALRLVARPATRTCIDCAEGPSSVPGRSRQVGLPIRPGGRS